MPIAGFNALHTLFIGSSRQCGIRDSRQRKAFRLRKVKHEENGRGEMVGSEGLEPPTSCL